MASHRRPRSSPGQARQASSHILVLTFDVSAPHSTARRTVGSKRMPFVPRRREGVGLHCKESCRRSMTTRYMSWAPSCFTTQSLCTQIVTQDPAFFASIRSQGEFPVLGLRGRQRKAFGLKDHVHGQRPTISASQGVVAGRVGGNLEGQARILNLYFQRISF